MDSHAVEVAQGERFEFGKNWASFLTSLTDRRIAQAEQSLRNMLDVATLSGASFLDIGSGSGLLSWPPAGLAPGFTPSITTHTR